MTCVDFDCLFMLKKVICFYNIKSVQSSFNRSRAQLFQPHSMAFVSAQIVICVRLKFLSGSNLRHRPFLQAFSCIDGVLLGVVLVRGGIGAFFFFIERTFERFFVPFLRKWADNLVQNNNGNFGELNTVPTMLFDNLSRARE